MKENERNSENFSGPAIKCGKFNFQSKLENSFPGIATIASERSIDN